MYVSRLLTLGAAVALAIACGARSGPDAGDDVAPVSEPLSVFVVNYPLQYFAERIGGDLVDVQFPMTGAGDPAHWSPDPETVAAYQGADLILLNGAGYARWIDQATLPISRIVDTSASFRSEYIPLEGAVTHSHGPEGAHEHTGWASTTWLDPTLAVEQARAVAHALIAKQPVYEAIFNERFIALEADLRALDQRQSAAASGLTGTTLVFSHPVYQYFQRRYDLAGASMHWEPDESPDLDELRHLLEAQPRWLIWESDPLPDTISRLESMGVVSVVYDPCAAAPTTGDFMTVMQANAAALERIAGG